MTKKGMEISRISSQFAIDGTFVLDNGDSLKAFTDITHSVQASVSYMQITNNEG